SAMNCSSGRLVVKPASLWHMTNFAVGLGMARLISSLVGTPVNLLFRRLQCVTQCRSQKTSTAGRPRISAYDRSYSLSHFPKTRRRHLSEAGSTLGTPP